ncbi:MAG: hypothetical protein KGL39_49650 [Patescibacteria group bacterium]|nr:hypothetical protein [Patescibacteria group bacterium]
MTRKTYKLSYECPACSKEMQIMELSACGKGILYVMGICVQCGKEITYEAEFVSIIEKCIEQDILLPIEKQMGRIN